MRIHSRNSRRSPRFLLRERGLSGFRHSNTSILMHTNTMVTFLVLIMIVLAGFVGWLLYTCESGACLVFSWQKERVATDFTRCAELGFPVMESYPRQCRAGTKTFVEDIEPLPQATTDERIRVTVPLPNATVGSPLTIRGEARGNWYFEASFPVRLRDGNGKELAVAPAQAQGEWMTTEFVPFEVTLTFTAPETETGTLILEKDNPSGLPEHDASISIPVRFAR